MGPLLHVFTNSVVIERQQAMQGKLPAIILATLVSLAGAYLLLGERQSQPDDSSTDQLLFPELEQQLNNITRIRVERDGRVYEVVNNNGHWQLPGKGGYPVLFERVKPLLLGIALLEKVEPKTDKPEYYSRLGVQSPDAESNNTRIELYTGSDAAASLIIGRIEQGLIAGGRDGIYARLSGDTRSWLVAGNLNLPQTEVDWVDRQIIHIKPKTVKRVTIRQPDDSRLVVEKAYRGAPGFTVINMSEHAGSQKPSAINVLARSLAGLMMDDILVRSEAGLAEAESVAAVFETWDGLQVTAYTVEQADKIFVWFDVGITALDTADSSRAETPQTDIAELRSRLTGWVYQIPRSRGDRLRTRLRDLSDTGDGLPLPAG